MTAGFDLAEQVGGNNGGSQWDLRLCWSSGPLVVAVEARNGSVSRGVGDLSCMWETLWLSQATAAMCLLGG